MAKTNRSQSIVEVVADTGDLCGEGPLWVRSQQALYWTDISRQRVYRGLEAGALPVLLHSGFEVTGMLTHADGKFVAVNSQGVWAWDGASRFQHIVSSAEGAACQLNDCVADKRGRVFSGSQFFNPNCEYERGKLFVFDTDGSARILDEGFELSNGVALSPDGSRFYLTDSMARRIYAYEYAEASGSLRNRCTLIQVGTEDGVPDGLTVDADGYLWSAHWYGGCIVRYDPDGKEERRISIPAKQSSSVTFGGSDFTDLYVTSAAHFEPGPVPTKFDSTGYMGGALYRVRCGIGGFEKYAARIPVPGF